MDTILLGTLLLLLLFPFGQLTRINLPFPGGAVYWHDLIIFIILITNLKKLPDIFRNNRYFLGFTVLSIFSLLLITSILPLQEVALSSLYLVRLVGYFCFFLLLLAHNAAFKQHLPTFLTICIAVSLILGIAQYILIPSFEFLYPLGWDRHYFRLAGSWLDVNFTGLLFVLFFIWLLHAYQTSAISKKLSVILLVADFAALLLTYSRSSYIVFAVAVSAFLLIQRKLVTLFILLLLLVVSIPLLPKKFGEGTNLTRLSTIRARAGDLETGIQFFLERPLFGYGFNTLRYIKRDTGLTNQKWAVTHSGAGLDNSLMFLLATTGLIGLYQYLLLWKQILKPYILNPLVIVSVLAVFLHGMFVNSWFYPWIMLWLFFILKEEATN